MIDTPFRRMKRGPMLATAASAALVLLTFGTTGCGGAGTPGLSNLSNNRANDLTDPNRNGTRGDTVATGRVGVFLTATTFETAPPPALDAVPTSADLPNGEPADAPEVKATSDKEAKAATAKGEETAKPVAEPNAVPDKTVPATAEPDAKPAPKAAPATAPAASALLTNGDELPPIAPAAPDAKPAPEAKPVTEAVAPAAAKKDAPADVKDAVPVTRAKTTDAAKTYNHIWATILKVELIDSGDNKATTVWEDAGGMTVDLQTLHDKNGRRFALITSAAVPSGRSYERVRLTLGNGFELFTPGSETGTIAPISDTLARDVEGRPIVSFGLARPRDLGTGKDALFVDFDLRKLQIDNGRVLPVVRESGTRAEVAGGEGVPSQQNAQAFAGIVTEWTPGKKAGEGAFTLATGSGQTVTVQTTSQTGVWNDDGKPSPVLANNKRIRVAGRLNVQTGRVMAEEVAVYPAANGDNALGAAAASAASNPPQTGGGTPGIQAAAERTGTGISTAPIALASELAAASAALANTPVAVPPAQVVGTVVRPDETAGTLSVKLKEVGGIVPTQGIVSVQVLPNAVYRGVGGMTLDRAGFFKDAGKAGGTTSVRAEGDYETATGAFKASRLVLVPAMATSVPPAHTVVVQGVPSKASVKNGSLQVANLTEWENIAASDGKNPVQIVLTAQTELRNETKGFIARENFFKAIDSPDEKNGLNVRVEGTYASGVLTATHIELRPATGKDDVPAIANPKIVKGDKEGDVNTAEAAKPSDDEPETPVAASPKKSGKSSAPVAPSTMPVPVTPPTIPSPPAVSPAKTTL